MSYKRPVHRLVRTAREALWTNLNAPPSELLYHYISRDIYYRIMDFRDMDRMGSSDEAIVDEPYRPFYSMILHKPVLVKQLENPNVVT
jgi:hypothetical protein